MAKYDDLPLLPGEQPKKPPAPAAPGHEFGRIVRDVAVRGLEAVQRPFVEPFLVNGPPAVAAAQNFGRGLTGAPPVSSTPPVTPPAVVPPPAPILPTPRAGDPAAAGFDVDATGIPGIQRITAAGQPDAAPLFTNIADTTAATRGIFDPVPGALSPESVARTIATSSVFQDARDQRAANLAAGAREYEQRQAEARTAADLNKAHGAVARGVTSSLRHGVPAKIFPEIVQSLGYLDAASAKGAPDVGDYAAITNAQTNQERLQNDRARLAQNTTSDAERGQRDTLKLLTSLAVNPQTGLPDPAMLPQILTQYGPAFGLGGGTPSEAPAAGGIDEGIANKLRAKGYSDTQIQQHLAQRAGQ